MILKTFRFLRSTLLIRPIYAYNCTYKSQYNVDILFPNQLPHFGRPTEVKVNAFN